MFITSAQLGILVSASVFSVLFSVVAVLWTVRTRRAQLDAPGIAAKASPRGSASSVDLQVSEAAAVTPGPAWRQTMGPESPHPLAWPVVHTS